jgi:hypothetical protein
MQTRSLDEVTPEDFTVVLDSGFLALGLEQATGGDAQGSMDLDSHSVFTPVQDFATRREIELDAVDPLAIVATWLFVAGRFVVVLMELFRQSTPFALALRKSRHRVRAKLSGLVRIHHAVQRLWPGGASYRNLVRTTAQIRRRRIHGTEGVSTDLYRQAFTLSPTVDDVPHIPSGRVVGTPAHEIESCNRSLVWMNSHAPSSRL